MLLSEVTCPCELRGLRAIGSLVAPKPEIGPSGRAPGMEGDCGSSGVDGLAVFCTPLSGELGLEEPACALETPGREGSPFVGAAVNLRLQDCS